MLRETVHLRTVKAAVPLATRARARTRKALPGGGSSLRLSLSMG